MITWSVTGINSSTCSDFGLYKHRYRIVPTHATREIDLRSEQNITGATGVAPRLSGSGLSAKVPPSLRPPPPGSRVRRFRPSPRPLPRTRSYKLCKRPHAK
ncbi:hypothetical protein J6590_026806 [Homalodisca vitripennis]|nr:hypothetical protein J6590_026806 [Homalodisca vitripennis]